MQDLFSSPTSIHSVFCRSPHVRCLECPERTIPSSILSASATVAILFSPASLSRHRHRHRYWFPILLDAVHGDLLTDCDTRRCISAIGEDSMTQSGRCTCRLSLSGEQWRDVDGEGKNANGMMHEHERVDCRMASMHHLR